MTLNLVGVGYKVVLEDNRLVLKVGFSHNIGLDIPAGITAKCPTPTKIVLNGCDLQKVTQFAALVRSKRPPEPYNGKGIFVNEETVKRKEGKKK